VVAAFRPSEPFGRVISGNQPASEIAAAGGDAALAISVAMPPLQSPRCQNYGLRVGGIDQRAEFGPPARQIWCRSALPWSMNISGVERAERG
jgi:hypothetical protein